MEYFRTLNLCREPFSTSPDPEFFFCSRQHAICLARLELSLRFRRGLNVVIGEVGTGKTTLCRQLIRKTAEDDKIESHLILAPYFSTPQEFLVTISGMFGLDSERQAQYSSWQLKEYIKNYLFRRGIDEQKIVVLIIDEGQKLPDFCLEILRELLNYETNEYKLLQTIIFAQEEFRSTINAFPNFADRISYCHVLGSMSFHETRQMIRFRLSQAKAGSEPPELFSFLGLLAVYRATGGYPRKVVHLCHRILLALIIQNRSKAGWSLARWCAKMLYTIPRKRPLLGYAFAVVFTLILIPAGAIMTGQWKLPSFLGSAMTPPALVTKTESPDALAPVRESAPLPPTQDHPPTETDEVSSPAPPGAPPPEISEEALQPQLQPQPQPQRVEPESSSVADASRTEDPSISASVPAPEEQADEAMYTASPTSHAASSEPTSPEEDLPAVLGNVSVRPHEGLAQMIRRIYGADDQEHLNAVIQANQDIRDQNHIVSGKSLRFPAIPMKSALRKNCWYVQIGEKENLDAAYELSSQPVPNGFLSRLIPYWDRQRGMRFSVILNHCFDTSESAKRAIKNLPPPFAGTPVNLASRPGDTVFFAR